LWSLVSGRVKVQTQCEAVHLEQSMLKEVFVLKSEAGRHCSGVAEVWAWQRSPSG